MKTAHFEAISPLGKNCAIIVIFEEIYEKRIDYTRVLMGKSEWLS